MKAHLKALAVIIGLLAWVLGLAVAPHYSFASLMLFVVPFGTLGALAMWALYWSLVEMFR